MENPQYAPDHGAHGSIYRGSGGKTQDQISEKKKQERIKEDRQRLKDFIEKERQQAKAARGDSGRFQRDVAQEQQRQIEESLKKKRREQRKQMDLLAQVEAKKLEDGIKLKEKIEEEKKEAAEKAKKQEEERQAKILKAQSDRLAEARAEREALEKVRSAEELKAALEEKKQQDAEETKDEEKTLSNVELLEMATLKKAYGLGKLYVDIKRLQETSYEVVKPAYVKQLGDTLKQNRPLTEILSRSNQLYSEAVILSMEAIIGNDDLSKLRSVRYLLLEMVGNRDTVLDAWGQTEVNETPEENLALAFGNALAIGEQPNLNEISTKLDNGLSMINSLAEQIDQETYLKIVREDLSRNKDAGFFGRETSTIKNSLHKDTHPMMLAKPAAPQLHMEKLHIQTGPNMKKLDLDTTSEAKEKDVELDDAECGMEHAEISLKDLKNKAKQMKEKAKKMYKDAKKKAGKAMKKAAEGIKEIENIMPKESEDYLSKKIHEGNLKECDKCGEIDDHFHVCAEDLSKPKCISDDIAERKLRELM